MTKPHLNGLNAMTPEGLAEFLDIDLKTAKELLQGRESFTDEQRKRILQMEGIRI
jgi:plasmid maintenance system antidote protein VapI